MAGKRNGVWGQHLVAVGRPWGYVGTKPSLTHDVDGRLNVFTTGAEGALWNISQAFVPTPPNGGQWSSWSSFGGVITSAVTADITSGRIFTFQLGTDSAVWLIAQDGPGTW